MSHILKGRAAAEPVLRMLVHVLRGGTVVRDWRVTTTGRGTGTGTEETFTRYQVDVNRQSPEPSTTEWFSALDLLGTTLLAAADRINKNGEPAVELGNMRLRAEGELVRMTECVIELQKRIRQGLRLTANVGGGHGQQHYIADFGIADVLGRIMQGANVHEAFNTVGEYRRPIESIAINAVVGTEGNVEGTAAVDGRGGATPRPDVETQESRDQRRAAMHRYLDGVSGAGSGSRMLVPTLFEVHRLLDDLAVSRPHPPDLATAQHRLDAELREQGLTQVGDYHVRLLPGERLATANAVAAARHAEHIERTPVSPQHGDTITTTTTTSFDDGEEISSTVTTDTRDGPIGIGPHVIPPNHPVFRAIENAVRTAIGLGESIEQAAERVRAVSGYQEMTNAEGIAIARRMQGRIGRRVGRQDVNAAAFSRLLENPQVRELISDGLLNEAARSEAGARHIVVDPGRRCGVCHRLGNRGTFAHHSASHVTFTCEACLEAQGAR